MKVYLPCKASKIGSPADKHFLHQKETWQSSSLANQSPFPWLQYIDPNSFRPSLLKP
nr:hypothetical protein Iba_chr09aCG12090 [Ipomoea batatas]GMD32717.1 hypothetical protein Iba_chr09bCG10880 [Ipomoea batatas]GMD35934.1 hypothetical protein Iba_chr09dCG11620 [Ipomoea batatas]GME12517.1 hypothetical protein Iba_scaffold13904CG0010 [Ipomoea batatas]